ncbi:hypothetical protein DITRI_Ditri03aG0054600 [Diplodiscus trichospermus]
MTTYGTIPAELPPSSDLIFRAREQIRSGLGSQKQWKEMIKIQAISLPSHLNDSIRRIRTNATYFRMNYLNLVLFLLFLTLLLHPVTLILLVIMTGAWLFLYFLRDNPVSFEGVVIDHRTMMTALLLVTIATLLLTDVIDNVIFGVSFGLGVVLVHGAFRSTDDLFFGDEEEANRSSELRHHAREAAPLPLKNAASSS